MADHERMLRKSNLGKIYRGLSPSQRALVLHDCTAPVLENKFSCRSETAYLTGAILPTIALYRALKKDGIPGSEVKKLIGPGIPDSATPMTRLFQTLGKLPFFFPVFRFMCRISTGRHYGSDSWHFQWKNNDNHVIAWECHFCLYVNVLSGYDPLELAPIFCERDDVMYGHIKNPRWGRTRTIGRGNSLCDFKFDSPKPAKKKSRVK